MAPQNGGYPAHILSDSYTAQTCILLLLLGVGHASDAPVRPCRVAHRSRYLDIVYSCQPSRMGHLLVQGN